MVAIVGTRQASPGGERIAHRLARALAVAGATVVSGMARGIDAAAHQGALDAGGQTIAVLAGGADLPYPPRHRALHAEIAASGLVLSEAPPGTRPIAGAFPRRNRVIAALCRALIVVEAGSHSGALITADLALDLGRAIGAVPGSIDSPRSTGANDLLRFGAVVVTSTDDALMLAGLSAAPPRAAPRRRRTSSGGDPTNRTRPAPRGTGGNHRPTADAHPAPVPDLGPAEAAVVSAIHAGAADVDAVAALAHLSSRDVATAVVGLELAGVLHSDHQGGIRLAR
jgi:DNA processing protein